MPIIYTGKYLTISYEAENSLFVQHWTKRLENIADFKTEMLAYTSLYKKHRPKYTLWLQEKFSLKINLDLQKWIEKNVNEPCFDYGNQKCAFVVSKDVIAHISVIDSFDKIQSCIIPKHFLNEQEARHWFKESVSQELPKSIQEKKIIYDGTDDKGNIIVKIPSKNIKNTFKTLHKSIEQEQFMEENNHKNTFLTKREKDILHLLAKGTKHQDIAKLLFISRHTVRTHIKNIKSKLCFEEDGDFVRFIKLFYS